jgi:hypothetical protein
MEASSSKMRRTMRNLHNNLGFIIVGLVVIYSLSGIVQTYRDTSFLKHEVLNEKTIDTHLDIEKLGKAVKQKDLKIDKAEGDMVYFKDGSYNTVTGEVKYTTKELYGWVKPFTELHKSNSKGVVHYFTIAFAVALFFMSISAFWMFKPGTKAFSSGVILTVVGIIASIILVLFAK